MGNKASLLFGNGGPKDDSFESDRGCSVEPTKVASQEEQAEAARYAELFGGKPKANKQSASGVKDFRHKHKQLRPSGTVGSDEGVSDGIDAGVAGGSNPTSPFRCKAGWVDENGKATKGGLDAPVSGAAAASSGAADENKKNVLPEAQRKKQIADAVAAKIEDLENEESQAGVVVEEDGLSVQNEGQTQAMVTATDSARERAAVEEALYAGTGRSHPSSKELLVGGEGGVLEAETGAGLGGVAAVPPKHINPRPAPQRNFNLKL